jgi:hypothetical protein
VGKLLQGQTEYEIEKFALQWDALLWGIVDIPHPIAFFANDEVCIAVKQNCIMAVPRWLKVVIVITTILLLPPLVPFGGAGGSDITLGGFCIGIFPVNRRAAPCDLPGRVINVPAVTESFVSVENPEKTISPKNSEGV